MAGLRVQAETGAETLKKAFPGWEGCDTLVQLGLGFHVRGLLDEEIAAFPLSELPGMPPPDGLSEPEPRLRFGRCGDRLLLVVDGHRYLFEGYGTDSCVLPVCAAICCGVRKVVLVEAGFSLREDFGPGTWVVLTDYVNAMGTSPLVGNTDLGPMVFLNVNDVFSQHLNSLVVNAIHDVGLSPRLGVCQMYLGPELPSPAEAAIARERGVDILSTGVLMETLAATAMGANVSALVLAGESAPTYRGKRAMYSDLMAAAEFCSDAMMRGLGRAFREAPE